MDGIPLKRIVGAAQHQPAYFDKGRLALRVCVTRQPITGEIFPPAIDAVHPAYLLFEDARIPFGVELHHDATGAVEIKALATDTTLCHQDVGRSMWPVESSLQCLQWMQRKGSVVGAQ